MKRVLFISHSFFDKNMGAIRQQRLARHLPRFGWEPWVFCAGEPPASFAGHALHAPAPDLARWYRLLRPAGPAATGTAGPPTRDIRLTSFINRWFMIPDKQAPWRRPALRAARTLLRQAPFDLLFASLEPRTNLRVAAQLAREFDLPCVMEYRDLWTGSPYHHLAQPTACHRRLHHDLERRAIQGARRVTAVSRGLARYLESAYRDELRAPVELNYNFFDPEEYPARQRPRAAPFVISYVGALYFSRQPRAFFEGFRLFIDRRKLTPSDIVFQWVGSSFSAGDLDALLDRLQLRPYVDIRGQVSHAAALQHLVDSDAALIIQSPDDDVHIPGKLFEAMGARVPVLALAQPCEVTEIMAATRSGVVAAHEADAVADALGRLHARWLSGGGWEFDDERCRRFSAGTAIERVAQLFTSSCADPK